MQAFGIALAGGDVVATPGPLTLSITAMGEVPSGQALRRNGVKDGDVIVVTGTIGDAALGLDMQRQAAPEALDGADRAYFLDRYRHPTPRLEAGAFLRDVAHAAMDISDGLLADVRHLAEASKVDILLDARRVPHSEAAQRWIDLEPATRERVLTGGDDYELVFSCSVDDFAQISAEIGAAGVQVTAIGRAEAGEGRVFPLRNRSTPTRRRARRPPSWCGSQWSRRMKRIVIVAVAVLLLTLGIGAGLYLFMPEVLGLKTEQAAEAPPPPPPPVEVKPTTVHVASIDVPVMIDGTAQRQIHFGVTLIAKPESHAKIVEELPRFRNAVIQFAYSGFPEQFSSEGRMDLPRLKATLLVLAKRTLGPGVEDVLIQSYFEM